MKKCRNNKIKSINFQGKKMTKNVLIVEQYMLIFHNASLFLRKNKYNKKNTNQGRVVKVLSQNPNYKRI